MVFLKTIEIIMAWIKKTQFFLLLSNIGSSREGGHGNRCDAAALVQVDSPIRLKRRGSQSNQVVEHKWGTRPDTRL